MIRADEQKGQGHSHVASRRDVLQRLLEVSKPERGRIGLGLVALVVNSATNLSFPWILGQAVDRSGHDNYNHFLAGAAGVFLLGSAASCVRVYCLGTATTLISMRIRKLLFDAYIDKDIEFFESSTSGELMTVLDKDVEMAAEMLTEKLANGLRSLNSAINGSIALFSIAPQLCGVSLAIVPIVGVGAMSLRKYSRLLGDKARQLEATVMSFALERIARISTVRLNGQESQEKSKYADYADQSYALSASAHYAQGTFMGFINLMSNVSLLTVLFVGGGLISKGKMTAGSLTRFAITSTFVGLGFSGLSNLYGDVNRSIDAARRIFTAMDKKPSTSAAPSATGTAKVDEPPAEEGGTCCCIDVRNVSFAYPLRPRVPVLRDISLAIQPKTFTAIVGQSGSGKSTLQALMCGLYKASSGEVRVVGRGARGDRAWVQGKVGVVEQNVGLLSGTVRENIAYGVKGASFEQVVGAAKAAAAHDFIMEFPEGYETQVGDGGARLSGGQRARVAIARSIIRDPACVLLDEATAALDQENEAEIVALLVGLSKTRTIVVFTHSEALMRSADTVVVLSQGTVRDMGSFSDLNKAGVLDDVLSPKSVKSC